MRNVVVQVEIATICLERNFQMMVKIEVLIKYFVKSTTSTRQLMGFLMKFEESVTIWDQKAELFCY